MDQKQLKSLAVLGYNFALHILRNLIPRKRRNQAEVFKGYFKSDWIGAFTPEEQELIFNLEACTVCGLCNQVCLPAFLDGKFLGPEHLVSCAGRSQPEYIFDLDDFYHCTLCGKCEEVCPEEVKISQLALLMRRWIERVNPERFWEIFPQVRDNLERFENPFGKPRESSSDKPEPGAKILFTGCYEQVFGEPGQWQELLKSWGIETARVDGLCCGGILEELGVNRFNSGVEKLLAFKPAEIITTCPHCYSALKKKVSEQVPVRFILELAEGGASELAEKRVLYFEPCLLRDFPELEEKALKLLEGLKAELVEYPKEEQGDCCGAGGGIIFYEQDFAYQLAEKKVQQAKKAGAEIILTECTLCQNLLSAPAKEQGLKVERLSRVLIRQGGKK